MAVLLRYLLPFYLLLIAVSVSGQIHEHQIPSSPGIFKQLDGPCVNMDFEGCDFTGWELFEGDVSSMPFEIINTVPTTPGNQHFITTAGNDPVIGAPLPMLNPDGGTCSVLLGDATAVGARAASMRQTFQVDSSNAIFTYSYALVLEDPSGHSVGEKPFFKTTIYDEQGNPIPCGDYSVIAGPPGSGGDPDFVVFADGYYLPWRTTFAPLDGYIGQNVTVEFIIGDCFQTGHYGYGYIDAQCNPMEIITSDTTVCGGQGVTLTAPAGAASYLWNTGETTQEIMVSDSGTYEVTLTPVTGAACDVTLSITITGTPGVPQAAFTFAPNPACPFDPISFTDNSTTTLGATIVQWEWDFGDMNTSAVQHPTHSYSSSGNYNIQLIVTTAGGCTDTIVQPITIVSAPDPTITPAGPFCATAPPHPFVGADPGGTWSSSCGNCIDSSTGIFQPSIAGVGNHEIIYTHTGPCSYADTTVVVINEIPVANFTALPNPVCINEQVTFTDNSTTSQGAIINNWQWDFGDQTNAIIQHPNHTYTTAGTYNVTLIITTDGGCTDTITQPITVLEIADPTIIPAGPFCDNNTPHTFSAVDPGGVWSSSCGNCIDSISGIFDPSIAGDGVHELVYTIAGSCGGSDTTTVAVSSIAIDSVTTTPLLCFGDCNSTLNIYSPGAVDFSIDNGVTWQTSNNFQNLCAGTYQLKVRNAISCEDSVTVTLTEPPLLNITFSAFDATCFNHCDGYAIVIPNGGISPYQYGWSSSGNNSPTENNLCAGNYLLTITDNNGCAVDTNFVVNQPPPFEITAINSTNELCFNDCSGTITITAPGATHYSIDNGTTLVTNNDFQNLCAGTYTIYVENAAGCFDDTTITIEGPPPVDIATTTDTTICIGGTAGIGAVATGGVGAFTYTWNNGLPSLSSHIVMPNGSTTYYVFATDSNGCTTPTLPITVNFHPPLEVQAFTDQTICVGDAVPISALASGGIGAPYSYTWDNGLGNGQFFSVSPTTTTTYTVVAADNCETPNDSAQVTITVNPLPNVVFEGDILEGCLPVTTTFTNNTNPGMIGNDCWWNFGEGTIVNDCGTPTHTFNAPGCYDVSLSVTSPEGCTNDTIIPNYICVYDYPVADFEFSPQATTTLQPEIEFTDQSVDPSIGFINSYFWNFDGLGTAQIQHPVFEFPWNDEGLYDVCLTVTSNYGCPSTICKPVKIDGEMLIYVPNAFTPNGDGDNDYFFAQGMNLDKSDDFTLYVFNRWGELIFETHNPNYPWDGKRYGRDVQQDVYVWRILLRDPYTDKKYDLIGHVTVLR